MVVHAIKDQPWYLGERVVYNITRYWSCDRSVLEDNGDERYTVKYPLIDIKTTFWKAFSVVSDFLNLSVPSWYDERRPGVPSIIINGKTWEQPVNFNWDSNSSQSIYCPLIYSRAKLDQRDQKFDLHQLLYPIRNRIDNRWSNLITNNINRYIIEPFSPSSIQNISRLPIPP